MNTASSVADLDQVRAAMERQVMFCRASNAPFTANVIETAGAGLANGGAVARLVVPWPGNPLGDASHGPILAQRRSATRRLSARDTLPVPWFTRSPGCIHAATGSDPPSRGDPLRCPGLTLRLP